MSSIVCKLLFNKCVYIPLDRAGQWQITSASSSASFCCSWQRHRIAEGSVAIERNNLAADVYAVADADTVALGSVKVH